MTVKETPQRYPQLTALYANGDTQTEFLNKGEKTVSRIIGHCQEMLNQASRGSVRQRKSHKPVVAGGSESILPIWNPFHYKGFSP